MNYKPKAIRTFLGSKNFQESRQFYKELSYNENVIDPKISYFQINDSLGFYLQDYYVKEWVENSMVFLEVEDLQSCHQELQAKNLTANYKNIKITKIINEEWGREFHLIDPAGILWHFAEFGNFQK